MDSQVEKVCGAIQITTMPRVSPGPPKACLILLLMVYSWEINGQFHANSVCTSLERLGSKDTQWQKDKYSQMKEQHKDISHENNLWCHSPSVIDLFMKHEHGICQISYSYCPGDYQGPTYIHLPRVGIKNMDYHA